MRVGSCWPGSSSLNVAHGERNSHDCLNTGAEQGSAQRPNDCATRDLAALADLAGRSSAHREHQPQGTTAQPSAQQRGEPAPG